jgi:hypothetical protein
VRVVPGEAISPAAFLNAPWMPSTLSVEIVGGGVLVASPSPATLSKETFAVDGPNATPVTFSPAASNRFTWSPFFPRPGPEP